MEMSFSDLTLEEKFSTIVPKMLCIFSSEQKLTGGISFTMQFPMATVKKIALLYRVIQVLPFDRKYSLLIDLKFSKNSGTIVYRCRIFCKNFNFFNETGILCPLIDCLP
jgi:hypothetical protein